MLPEKLTQDFYRHEFQCPCCLQCKMDSSFMSALQQLRDDFNEPMHPTSGYRCPKYNEKKRGAKNSYHMQGLAVDIACTDMFDRYRLINLALKHGFTGIEISPTHVHLDRRSTTPRLMWTDNKGTIV